MNSNPNLPVDVSRYLGSSNRVWDIGLANLPHVTLFTAAEAPLRSCDIQSRTIFARSRANDPGEVREYFGIDIVKDCGPHYISAEGRLMWFPDWNEYGIWNPYEHLIFTFPNVIWSEIVESPSIFLNALMKPEPVYPCRINPWHEFPNEERSGSLLLRSRRLMKDNVTFARGLRLAMAATQLDGTSDKQRHLVGRVASDGMRLLLEHPDALSLCNEILNRPETPVVFRQQLENAAARSQWNSGDEAGAIARLRRVIEDNQYSEHRKKFEAILAKLLQSSDE